MRDGVRIELGAIELALAARAGHLLVLGVRQKWGTAAAALFTGGHGGSTRSADDACDGASTNRAGIVAFAVSCSAKEAAQVGELKAAARWCGLSSFIGR